jgi:protein-disulfide isomerase
MTKPIRFAAAAALILMLGAVGASFLFSAPSANAAKSPAEKKEIEGIIYDYLMENPEVILEAVQRLQQREAAEEKAKVDAYLSQNRDKIEGPEGSFIAGNPNGDVTIVEFFDYHCTYCKQNLNALLNFVEADGNIKLVLREFPALRNRAPSMEAAMAAVASMDQGKYMEFHLALMRSKGTLSQTRIEDIAQSVGVDIVELNAKLKDKSVEKIVEDNMDMAHALGIDGTPSFVIGGNVVIGLRSSEELEAIVAAVRAEAKG